MTPPPSAPFPNRRHWLWLAAGLCVLFVGFLGARGLNEPDEGRYANIAMAMAAPGGDWWEPRMSGFGHYDKPPLVYWATAASFRAFGLNEWAARLPSLLGALLTLGGLGWTACRLRGAAVAWWAVLICGTSVQFWVFGRVLSPDMLLTGWCTLAVAAWAEGRRKAEGRRQKAEGRRPEDPLAEDAGAAATTPWLWWCLSLAAWTLAWWTKATPALVPLAGLTLGVLLTRDLPGRRALQPLLTFPAMLVLGSPWYLSMLSSYPELKSFFFGRELAGRLAGRVDGRHGVFLYYLPVSLVAWLPWWPVAVWARWRERRRLPRSPWNVALGQWTRRIGVEGWIVLTGLLILSLTASKLPSYTLPLAPWAALLMARAVAAAARDFALDWRQPWQWPAIGFFLVALVGSATLPRRYESHLGVNSSLREVSQFLRAQGAARVDTDRYWPGLEFYLGPDVVRYVMRIDGTTRGNPAKDGDARAIRKRAGKIERYHERLSDPGAPPDRFLDPAKWPQSSKTTDGAPPPKTGWWYVRYHRRGKSSFDRNLQRQDAALRPVKVKRIGEFDLYRMPDLP